MTKKLSFEKEICLNYDIPFEYMDRIVKKNYERGKKDEFIFIYNSWFNFERKAEFEDFLFKRRKELMKDE